MWLVDVSDAILKISAFGGHEQHILVGAKKFFAPKIDDSLSDLKSVAAHRTFLPPTGEFAPVRASINPRLVIRLSQRVRKRIEEAFGWIKTVARQEKTKFRGCGRVGWAFTFAAAAYNLVRLPKLIAEKG